MKRNCSCPITQALNILGDKWSLIVLRDILFRNKKHFNQLIDSPEKISTNILANRLKRLQDEKLLRSKVDQNNKRVKIYTATQKAKDLEPLLFELFKWGQKYQSANFYNDLQNIFTKVKN